MIRYVSKPRGVGRRCAAQNTLRKTSAQNNRLRTTCLIRISLIPPSFLPSLLPSLPPALSLSPTDSLLPPSPLPGYHAGSDDRVLRRKQKGLWEPLLEFVGSDSVLGEGVAVLDGDFVLGSLKHSDEVVRRAKELVWGYDVWELTALQAVTMEAKSLLVGLCVLEGFLTADAAVAASRVEEEFSVEQWGLVEGGHDMDRLNNDVQIRAAVLLLDTLKMN